MRRSWGTPDPAGGDQLPDLSETGIKTPVEAHLELYTGFGHGGQGLVDSVHIERDRLLTKDMLSRLGRLDHHPGMGIRGGTDYDRANGFILQQLTVITGCDRHFQLSGHLPGGLYVHIRDGGKLRTGNPELDIPRVDLADPSGPNDTYIDFIHHFSLLQLLIR